MDDLTVQLIHSVCMKCQAYSIIDTFRKWGRLSEDQLQYIFGLRRQKSMTKQKLTQSIVELVHDQEEVELTTDIAGDLELSYIQLHPMKKIWKVFKLTGGNLKQDPRILRSRLVRELQAKWKDGIIYGNMGYYSGAIWLRMHLDTSKRKRKKNPTKKGQYNPNNSVFILHFQGSPYLIMSNTRVKETTIMTKSLMTVFNADNLTYMQLSDRHVFSLADIALKQNHETSTIHKFKEVDDSENPLSLCNKKRKLEEDIFQDTESISDENRNEKHLRRVCVDNKFGPGTQPALEKLEYKFSMDFHCKLSIFDNLSGDCKTEVSVKGTSVLNGLKQLANKGFMTFPLPRHLTGVLADQRNNFTVVNSKSKNNTNDK